MLAFSGVDKSRKTNKYWYKACRVIIETKGNGGTGTKLESKFPDKISGYRYRPFLHTAAILIYLSVCLDRF